MSDLLIATTPRFVELIKSGRKTACIHKQPPRNAVERIYIYTSAPVQSVELMIECAGSAAMPSKINVPTLCEYYDLDGLTAALQLPLAQFCAYINGSNAFVIYIKKAWRFRFPVHLCELALPAPQNWRYLSQQESELFARHDKF